MIRSKSTMSDDKEDTNDQRMEGNGRLPTSAQIPTTKRMSRSVTASSRQSATTKKKRVVVPNSNTQFAAADGCDNADATNSDDDNSVQRLLLQRRMLSLVGCRLVRRWIDQQDRPRCIFGTITDCLPSSEKEAMMLTMRDFQYRVNYDTLKEFHEETKETTNVFDRDTSSCQDRSMCLDLPQSELLDMEHAWSGCWDYLDWDDNKCQSHTFLHVQNSTNMSEMENDVDEVDTFSLPTSRTVSAVQQRTILTNHSPPRWSLLFWKIPQSMHRQMRSLSTSGATDLTGPKQTSQSPVMVPNVTITYQDFHLDLKVQPSSLDSRHAGLGVFLRCSTITSCNGTCIEPVLELATGELLDIGIYAPFRSQDIQVVADFNEKDARLGGKCLDFCFVNKNGDKVLDITDENGNLHSIARQHVAPYVNEVTDPFQNNDTHTDTQSVFMAFDAQGALHYLLGNRYVSDGPFRFPADGTERELFTDYGVDYELVRQRKGYGGAVPVTAGTFN